MNFRAAWRALVGKSEKRNFTDSIVGALESQAAEGPARAQATAALESAVGLYARAMASARVDAPPYVQAAVTPSVLEYLGRRLIRTGDAVLQIVVEGAMVTLRAPGSWYVRGPADERQWRYWLSQYGPTDTSTALVPGSSVIHVRFAFQPERPWLGLGPVQWAKQTGALLGNAEVSLSQEASGPVGHVIPVPVDGGESDDDDTLAPLRADISAARGAVLLTETTSAGFGEGRLAAPLSDWKPKRFGQDPPSAAVTLRADAARAILGACGVPSDLVLGGDGAGQREAWRRFLHGSVRPVAALVEEELSRKLDAPVRLDFSELHASDVMSRARAFQSMVGGGMEREDARMLAGLDAGDAR